MNKNPDNDPAWDLLGNASQQKANPMFSRDVMRSIRLDLQQPASWWQRILRPAPITGTLTTAAACVALALLPPTEQPEKDRSIVAQSDENTISLGDIADIFDSSDELDDIICPIDLLASNDLVLQDYEVFINY